MTLINKLKVAGTIGITALVAGCGTVGPDGRTDGERIMDGFTESFIGGGGLFRANEQIEASKGNYEKAAGWGALGNAAEANYDRQTQIEAAREGRTQVNVNIGTSQSNDYIVVGDKKIYGQKQPDGTTYYPVPQDPESQRIIQERIRQIGSAAAPIREAPARVTEYTQTPSENQSNPFSRVFSDFDNNKKMKILYWVDQNQNDTLNGQIENLVEYDKDCLGKNSVILPTFNESFFGGEHITYKLKDEKGNYIAKSRPKLIEKEKRPGVNQITWAFHSILPIRDLKEALEKENMLDDSHLKKYLFEIYVGEEKLPVETKIIVIDFDRNN